jgi:hypothetical protein
MKLVGHAWATGLRDNNVSGFHAFVWLCGVGRKVCSRERQWCGFRECCYPPRIIVELFGPFLSDTSSGQDLDLVVQG